jgi:hypothetical protein
MKGASSGAPAVHGNGAVAQEGAQAEMELHEDCGTFGSAQPESAVKNNQPISSASETVV